jgi:hypothetical protein
MLGGDCTDKQTEAVELCSTSTASQVTGMNIVFFSIGFSSKEISEALVISEMRFITHTEKILRHPYLFFFVVIYYYGLFFSSIILFLLFLAICGEMIFIN